MRTHRLRWQLAVGQAVLALALVFGGTVVLASRTDDLRRAEAVAGAQRDAEVLASQVGPRLAENRPVAGVVTDSDSRRVEVTDPHGNHLGGDLLSADQHTAQAIDDVVNNIGGESDATGVGIGSAAVGIEPVLVNDELQGVVVVSEPAPVRRGWRELYGLDPVSAALLCLAAAAMGWWLAGRITKPLSRLSERARALVLSNTSEPSQPSRITEVAVLDAAINRVGRKISHEATARELLELDLRRLSHELRTPLTTIRLRLDDLAENDDGPASQLHTSVTDETLQVISGQLDRLDRLAGQLSQLRHVNHAATEVDLSAVVASVVDRLRPLAEWGRVELHLDVSGPARVVAEREAIEDSVSNVIENAIKHSPRGEKVMIAVRCLDGYVETSVSDAGPGIAVGLRDVITHPGVRVVGSTVIHGTGQGLAIVAATVDRYGGRLEIADSPRRGALVRIILPACPATDPAPRQRLNALDPEPSDRVLASNA